MTWTCLCIGPRGQPDDDNVNRTNLATRAPRRTCDFAQRGGDLRRLLIRGVRTINVGLKT